jgi:hypothetical protein
MLKMLYSTFEDAERNALDQTAFFPGNTYAVFETAEGFVLVRGSGHYSAPKGKLLACYLNGKRV